jgi:hypothetical protein
MYFYFREADQLISIDMELVKSNLQFIKEKSRSIFLKNIKIILNKKINILVNFCVVEWFSY